MVESYQDWNCEEFEVSPVESSKSHRYIICLDFVCLYSFPGLRSFRIIYLLSDLFVFRKYVIAIIFVYNDWCPYCSLFGYNQSITKTTQFLCLDVSNERHILSPYSNY